MALLENALTTADKIRLATNDPEKEDLINAASEIIEGYCNTQFGKAERTLKLKPTGEKYLCINFWNIHSAQVLSNGEEITDFTILGNQGMLYRSERWPESEDYSLEVTLIAGYILPKDGTSETPRDLPQAVEHACILFAHDLYNQLENGIDIQRQTRGSISTSYYARENKLPAAVRALLSRWRFIPV